MHPEDLGTTEMRFFYIEWIRAEMETKRLTTGD